jgi:hypothetical protein
MFVNLKHITRMLLLFLFLLSIISKCGKTKIYILAISDDSRGAIYLTFEKLVN